MPLKSKPKPKPKAKEKESKAKAKPKEQKKGLTFEVTNETSNENKYALKVKSLVDRLKNKNADTDNRIRFCWKN